MGDMAEVAEAITRQHNTLEMTEARILRMITRDMMSVLDSYQMHVILFIFSRTWQYGKPSERIPMKHFIEGVWSGDQCIQPGVNMSRAQIYKSLAKLAENVCILRSNEKANEAPTYAINPAWSFYTSLGVSNRDSTVSNRDKGVSTVDYINREKNKGNSNRGTRTRARDTESVNMDAMDRARAAVAAATVKTQGARDKKKAKANASAYESQWQAAQLEHLPEERWFPWTIAKKAAFKRAMDRGVPLDDRAAFITFVVSRFVEIVSERFAWMKQPPSAPHVGFVTQNITVFWQAFEDGRDPNRKIKRRIATSSKAAPQITATPQALAKLKALEEENAKLKAEAKARDQAQAIGKRKVIKRLTRAKPRAEIGGEDREFQYRDD